MGRSKKCGYGGGGRDQKGTSGTMDLGCSPSSALKGSCPIPGLSPESHACSDSPRAAQLYLQTQEMGVEEGIPALGLDPALLGSDPCHAIPRGVSDGTAAGSELGRIFS